MYGGPTEVHRKLLACVHLPYSTARPLPARARAPAPAGAQYIRMCKSMKLYHDAALAAASAGAAAPPPRARRRVGACRRRSQGGAHC